MNILLHALSGVAVTTVVAAFANTTPRRTAGIIATGIFATVLPDIDTISTWPHFDAVFGKLFGLSHSGQEIYGAQYWYSHHAFFHSLLAGLLFGLLLTGFVFIIRKYRKKVIDRDYRNFLLCIFIAAVAGYWMHLLGDLPTPASVWEGIQLFWPAKGHVGGYGYIWWWNNYDIFLILFSCVLLSTLALLGRKFYRHYLRLIVGGIFLVSAIFIAIQIKNREHIYYYSSKEMDYEMDEQSKKEQERILGKRCFRFMEKVNRLLPFHFQ